MKQRHLNKIIQWYKDNLDVSFTRKEQQELVNSLDLKAFYSPPDYNGVVTELIKEGTDAYSIHRMDTRTGKWTQDKWID